MKTSVVFSAFVVLLGVSAAPAAAQSPYDPSLFLPYNPASLFVPYTPAPYVPPATGPLVPYVPPATTSWPPSYYDGTIQWRHTNRVNPSVQLDTYSHTYAGRATLRVTCSTVYSGTTPLRACY